MTSQRQHGFTLIEVVIFIVVVGVGVAGILSVYTNVVKSSADPMVRKQAVAMAESVLEEILQKEYSNPPGGGYSGTDRTLVDDVDDYKSLNAGQIQTMFADTLAYVPGYAIAIDVGNESTPFDASTKMKRVAVTVSRGNESVTLAGYRGDY